MSINATPEYERADRRYRQARTPAERLEALEEMLRLLPKHKASEKRQSELKRKISALRKDLVRGGAKGGGGAVDPYNIPPGGAGQVVLVGLPNTGKSSIVASLTHAATPVADYPFTTTKPAPGMCDWLDVKIELVDTPPVTAEHIEGGMVNLLRRADAIAVVADAASPESLDQVEVVLALLAERRIDLVDGPVADSRQGDRWVTPGVLAVTHVDVAGAEEVATLAELTGNRLTAYGLDCPGGGGFEAWLSRLWDLLQVIRVYTRRPGQKAERKDPFILPAGATLAELARTIHRELPAKLKFARIWGTDRHDGIQICMTEPLRDNDLVEIHE